ncbi:extracellular catalytic domain type 1 short-chain-length polyhydroxyalkanoate depolymerase [Blastomonas fulva]|uniref:extracellular catalytic domain type 1 short-chain-length polyhydroxyalkanoate depolymerase n=1 Tax=Blastomonas fulva TaxID=1550728 RepID=UPI003F6EFB6D
MLPRPLVRLGAPRGYAGLSGWLYLPRALAPAAPLVVALHGCTQTASLYTIGSGWWRLADAYDFALLLPEQSDRNNPGLCFRWYDPDQTRRHHGEVAGIAAMIVDAQARHRLDPARCMVTGLSAGGAMTMAMLACYPELFAAAAPVAGVPFGAAFDVASGLAAMSGEALPGTAALAAATLAAAPQPRNVPLSLWQGLADDRVNAVNARAIESLWQSLGRRVEGHYLPGMGHGLPIGPGGIPGPHFLPGFADSTREIARFFGLLA